MVQQKKKGRNRDTFLFLKMLFLRKAVDCVTVTRLTFQHSTTRWSTKTMIYAANKTEKELCLFDAAARDAAEAFALDEYLSDRDVPTLLFVAEAGGLVLVRHVLTNQVLRKFQRRERATRLVLRVNRGTLRRAGLIA